MEYKIYSDQLTAAEAELGFQRVTISNPDHQYMGHGSMTIGVVYSLGPNDRIIKLNKPTPMGGASYVHQTFGVYRAGDPDPDWKPTFVGFDDAGMALRAAKSGRRDVPVTPTASVIGMRCPKCGDEFEAQADFLPLGGQTSCPKCKHTDRTESFDAPNI